MAASSGGSADRSLLDRLNALKPTSVNLDTAQNALNPSAPPLGEETARQDALSARLRTLRSRPEGEGVGSNSAQPATTRLSIPTSTTSPQPGGGVVSGVETRPPAKAAEEGDEDDPLHIGDEKALQEFLEDLASGEEQWDSPEDNSGPQFPDLPDVPGAHDVGEDKVTALLAKLRKETEDAKRRDGGDLHHDDDSEEGDMSREVEKVLAQAWDEAELEQNQSKDEGAPDIPEPRSGQQPQEPSSPSLAAKKDTPSTRKPKPAQDIDGPGSGPDDTDKDTFALPSAPTTPTAAAKNASDTDELPFKLPTVPTAAVDSWEDSIAARMAALKGPGKTIATDDWGLPSAPTFQPEDHTPPPARKKAKGAAGYTDEDQKTWCIVCLEDATVRCEGCDDDVYCWRCWREMHVGPAAGYDERGHKWAKFEKGVS